MTSYRPLLRLRLKFLSLFVLLLFCAVPLHAGGRTFIQLKDFEDVEIKSAGFTLRDETKIHISALGGGGEKGIRINGTSMYAYGWIIDAETRRQVWVMDRFNTARDGDDRRFDGAITLERGSYEVYFSAYAYGVSSSFGSYYFNVDRRDRDPSTSRSKRRGFFSWLEDLFDGDGMRDWKHRSKRWGIELSVPEGSTTPTQFAPPMEFPNKLFQAVRLGEDDHIKQAFTISKPTTIRIYALGEMVSESPADYGWIVDRATRKRIWEMKRRNLQNAGGAEKNVRFDDVISLPAGEYVLYYNTDDSHSFLDWNAAPPDDPFHYGITLMTTDQSDKAAFALTTTREEQDIIAQLTRLGNDEARNISFTLKRDTKVRVYALGERGNSRRQMADFGWIMNAKTRDKVWTMDVDRTDHAGGAQKNRMIDEIIALPRGTYTVFYQTDDSHTYKDWNASPPFDPEHWGITITGEGEGFTMSDVEKNVTPKQTGVLAQIVAVGDHAERRESFKLDSPTRVRIYAIGEGQNREMYDYGWIIDTDKRTVVWEMTYAMTFHAGGARKNRIVNTTLLLDKGNYELRYLTDDSHSYPRWNSTPPDDPTMWGITLYKEE